MKEEEEMKEDEMKEEEMKEEEMKEGGICFRRYFRGNSRTSEMYHKMSIQFLEKISKRHP